MGDYYEIDFHEVHTSKSGDAITIRYEVGGIVRVHVVDGGYVSTGESIVSHIREYYGVNYIDNVVVTHNDSDHACGLRSVLEEFYVGALWMLRPWEYADYLLPRFKNYNSAEYLRRALRSAYSNLAALEDLALEKDIPIYEPFQGEKIGHFTVLAPSFDRYLDLVVESEKTPEPAQEASLVMALEALAKSFAKKAANMVRAAWGEEVFSTEETSAENEMSVVQYAELCGKRLLLTGDTGRNGLREAADYAYMLGFTDKKLDFFQVPHHGSRRNVSTETLDRWLGERLDEPLPAGQERFTAMISVASEDTDHPRKAVVRAMIHRGATVVTTGDEQGTKRHQFNAPARNNWTAVKPLTYPEEREE